MATFKVKRTDHEELVFDGELLAKSCSPGVESEEGQRGYDLELYKTAENRFVVSIVYVTTCHTEQTVSQAELLDTPDDVEKILLVYEPCEYVDRKMLRALPEELRHRLRKKLYKTYDDQVSTILDALTCYCRDWQRPKEAALESVATTKRGILGYFGIK